MESDMEISSTEQPRTVRDPGKSYEAYLSDDPRSPAHLRQYPKWNSGTESIPASRYYSQEYHDLEAKYMWSRVWLMACREEHIPNPGDCYVFDHVGRSLIITRTKSGAIKAYHNACPHRGRKLVTANGNRANFWCAYHGMTWQLDGTGDVNHIAWDFPQWDQGKACLKQVLVDTWGGFVFVNHDTDAEPLSASLGPIVEHFAPYEFEKRYVGVHLRKIVRANWKVTAEAFMEAFHVNATHPQLMRGIADVNSQYDIISEFVSRNFSALAAPSPLLNPQPTEAEVNDYMHSRGSKRTPIEDGDASLPDNKTARQFFCDRIRQSLSKMTGRTYDHAADAEIVDTQVYNMFPNFSPWSSYAPNLVYNFWPNGNNAEESIMDIMVLFPHADGKPNPEPAEIIHVGLDESCMPHEDKLGILGLVLDQDFSNLPYVQEGLRSLDTGLAYAQYTECRLRYQNQLIHKFINDGLAKDDLSNTQF
jgi:phenylpropionate dioxygenase-like ring-hydroxylating dioxygenase large terminal subunit